MPIINQGKRNLIDAPDSIGGNTNILIKGNGNRLIIGKETRLPKVRISIIGDNCELEIEPGCKLRGILRCLSNACVMRIGAGTTGQNVKICLHEPGLIQIGQDCMFSGNVRVDNSDVHTIIDVASGRRVNPAGDVVVENHVWVGYGALISKSVHIGHDSIIGSGAVVTTNIPAHCIAAGVPARVIREGITWSRNLIVDD